MWWLTVFTSTISGASKRQGQEDTWNVIAEIARLHFNTLEIATYIYFPDIIPVSLICVILVRSRVRLLHPTCYVPRKLKYFFKSGYYHHSVLSVDKRVDVSEVTHSHRETVRSDATARDHVNGFAPGLDAKVLPILIETTSFLVVFTLNLSRPNHIQPLSHWLIHDSSIDFISCDFATSGAPYFSQFMSILSFPSSVVSGLCSPVSLLYYDLNLSPSHLYIIGILKHIFVVRFFTVFIAFWWPMPLVHVLNYEPNVTGLQCLLLYP